MDILKHTCEKLLLRIHKQKERESRQLSLSSFSKKAIWIIPLMYFKSKQMSTSPIYFTKQNTSSSLLNLLLHSSKTWNYVLFIVFLICLYFFLDD